MPAISAGARVAPITNEVAVTMVRDAKKSCPEEGLDHARSQNVGSQISRSPAEHDGEHVPRHS